MRAPSIAAVDRLIRTPVDVLAGAHRLTRGALGNARRSLEEIGRSVEDRHALQEHLEGAESPGDLEALGLLECRALLETRSVGRLAYIARADTPDIVPVNYAMTDSGLLIRSGSGPKLAAAQRRDNVVFEVDDLDHDRHDGWSVVVSGRLTVLDPATTPGGPGPEPWAVGPRRHLMLLEPRRITGRRLLGERP